MQTLNEKTWLNLVFKCSPDLYEEEKEKFLSSLQSKQMFNTFSQINVIARKAMKVVKKPWFIKEALAEKTYLITKEDELQVLVLREPQENWLKHRNLKIPELEGDDGIIIDIERKTQRKVCYLIFGYAPSIYEMT